MTASAFWDSTLEPNGKLRLAGRSTPSLRRRNWQLYGLTALAVGILVTHRPSRKMWLLAACGILVLIPIRAIRALFLRVDIDQTRVKAYLASIMTTPVVHFLRGVGNKTLGFDFFETAPSLLKTIRKIPA
ncbi:hypothetical protein [uncultured Sulfitobacter sp.]|uniref:hypothetical protein n=1 Tax=uncultured Sulfitobacter sp. TaxID=191468 RepID=UPI0026108903|nr:hypothetical protein [uncultured Sulfitobacter sp.]